MSDEEDKMPLFQHLEELRGRILFCGLAIGVGFVLCYFFKDRVFDIFILPWVKALPKGQPYKLIYTVPYEAFLAEMEVSFIGGVILASPIILWEIWRFVAPGLYANERKYILPVIFTSVLFFAAGVLFGYFIVVPVAFKFFASPTSPYITPMMSIDKYLGFAEKMLLCFGLVFELPVFAFFLAKLGVLSSDFLRRKRKWAIVLIFIAAAVLTPSPDIVSQLLMALPLLVLYEVSVWVVYFFGARPVRVAEQTGE